MTSQVLCFQRHSRQCDQNEFVKRSNVLYYHEHPSAQSHITRSEFRAYETSSEITVPTSIFRYHLLTAGLHSTLPTHVKFTISSKYQLICCISTSLNKRHFSNYPKSPLNQSASSICLPLYPWHRPSRKS